MLTATLTHFFRLSARVFRFWCVLRSLSSVVGLWRLLQFRVAHRDSRTRSVDILIIAILEVLVPSPGRCSCILFILLRVLRDALSLATSLMRFSQVVAFIVLEVLPELAVLPFFASRWLVVILTSAEVLSLKLVATVGVAPAICGFVPASPCMLLLFLVRVDIVHEIGLCLHCQRQLDLILFTDRSIVTSPTGP